jgi:bifunctional DNA-binding transcriptional regulator/antitoxin component of YhaV-PrlF toxin-antitoxin module
LWSAKAVAKVDTINRVIPIELNEAHEVSKNEVLLLEIDLSEVKIQPTITLINKYGEVVAEFYGDKSALKNKFKDSIRKGQLITSFGNSEFYLL